MDFKLCINHDREVFWANDDRKLSWATTRSFNGPTDAKPGTSVTQENPFLIKITEQTNAAVLQKARGAGGDPRNAFYKTGRNAIRVFLVTKD